MLKFGVGLNQAVLNKFAEFVRGPILDAGAGTGELAVKLAAMGYEVSACDCESESHWPHGDKIAYRQCDMNVGLPYADETFNYVVCLEVIEHLENPFALCRELKRVLRPSGRTIVSTPNILSMRSRIRFLVEGNYRYFDWPVIEWDLSGYGGYVHVNPIRFHEMEYFFYKAGFEVEEVFTSERYYGWRLLFPLEWYLWLVAWNRERRFRRRGKVSLRRLHSRILTDTLLYGEHLIVCAKRP